MSISSHKTVVIQYLIVEGMTFFRLIALYQNVSENKVADAGLDVFGTIVHTINIDSVLHFIQSSIVFFLFKV